MSAKPKRGRGWAAATVALSAICLFVFAPLAHATYDPLSSGTTKLTLDKGLLSLLRENKVKLKAKSPAKLKGGVLTLPVSGGEFDPTIAKGTIEHAGVLLFASAHASVPFKALTLKTKRSPLYAKVGGSQLKVASAAKVSSKRDGFGEDFATTGLRLTAKVAERLDKKLRLGKALEQGQPFGQSSSQTQPATIAILPQGQATLTPTPEFIAKLKALFVSLNPIFPAEGTGGAFELPIISGSTIAPNASSGTLRTGGSLEFLQLAGGQVFWHEAWADLDAQALSAEADIEPTPAYPGKLGRVGVLGLSMMSASVSSDPRVRTVSVTGAPLTLSAQSAASFNEAFAGGKGVFAAGEAVGVIGFAAVGE